MSALLKALRALVTVLLRPRATAEALLAAPALTSRLAVLVVGLTWGALSATLHLGGHSPSAPVLFYGRPGYYLMQAILLPVLLPAGWGILAVVAGRTLGAPTAGVARALAAPYAGAVLWGLVVPDTLAYAVGGFEGLGRILPITGGLVVVGASVLGVRAAAALGGTLPRRISAVLLGLVAQASLLSTVVR